MAQHERDDGGTAGAVDVVVAEHGHGFLGADGLGEAVGGLVHVCKYRGVRHQGAQGGVEEIGRGIDADAAGGDQAADDLRQRQALGDGLADAFRRFAPYPAAPGDAAGYAENVG